MQFFGLKEKFAGDQEKSGCFVSALEADKKTIYFCPECRGAIKVRSGPHRRSHFYHLSSPKKCTQHQKSLEHLLTQMKLKELLGEENARMELPFPEIQRIADVAWLPQKIVFEVQCSPISLDEATQRTEDYKGLGWHVVWILHDKRFNQRRLSAAEAFLRSRGAYFCNTTKEGKGSFYDQYEVLDGFLRKRKQGKLPFLPVKPYQITLENGNSVPEVLKNRIANSSFYFEGDLVSFWLQNKKSPLFNPLPEKQEKKPFFIRLYRRLLLGVLSALTQEDFSNLRSK